MFFGENGSTFDVEPINLNTVCKSNPKLKIPI